MPFMVDFGVIYPNITEYSDPGLILALIEVEATAFQLIL